MKRLFILLMTTLILLIPSSVLAKDWPSETGVDLQKTWTIKFNSTVDPTTVISSNVYVDGVATTVTLGADGKSIIVNPPVDGYQPGHTYYLHISKGVMSKSGRALIEDNIKPFTAEIGGSVDEPPTTPTGFTVTAGQGQYTCSWDLNSESDIKGYRLRYSANANGPWELAFNDLGTTELPGPIFIIGDVPDNTTNYFYLTAVDEAGNESKPTETKFATTPAGYAIVPPMTLWADDETNTYLGKVVSNEFDTESIFNDFGTYGNEFSETSIWNPFGTYGSEFSAYSAFNSLALHPPIIKDATGTIVGILTTNKYIVGAVSPVGLQQSLENMGY